MFKNLTIPKRLFVLVSIIFVLFFGSTSYSYAVTSVTTHSTNTNSVGRYNKFEVTFQISRQFPADSLLPYYFYDPTDTQPITAFPKPGPVGADGITIDGHFIAPSGKELVVPAFYMQEYTRGSSYRINLTNNFSWKIRFAPEEVGQYQFFITIQDKNGTSRYPTSGSNSFQSTNSDSKGFVRKSTTDSRFWVFSNGDSYIPNSASAQWWKDGRSDAYEKIFTNFKNNNINFTRIWDQNDGYGLTVEGPYDAYPDNYPEAWGLANKDSEAIQVQKGTQMNQRGNAEEDIILESAKQNGVYIQLCSHSDPYWIWDASVHNEGWNLNRSAFDSTKHINYWKRNLRYRVARWGYSTSVYGWEIWNEHGQDMFQYTGLVPFYNAIESYLETIDPFDHLRTTSQGSQNWSPGFWDLPIMDAANYHDYMMPGRFSADLVYDATNFVYRFAQCLRTSNGHSSGCNLGIGDGTSWNDPNSKPIIWGELDTGTNSWNEPNPQPTARLNMRWAGLFSPIGMAPVDWFFIDQSSSFIQDKYKEAKIAGDFFKDVKYDKAKFSYLSTSDVGITSGNISTTNTKIRVLGMRSQDTKQFYAYAQHKDFKWANGTSVPSAVSGQFTVGGMQNGQYNVEFWDTTTGAKTNGTASVSNGNLTISTNNLSKSIAIKARHSTYDPTQPTATPTQNSCPTDINQDNITDISDYAVLVSDFLKTNPSNPRSDINSDGIVDISDYAVLVQKFLQTCN